MEAREERRGRVRRKRGGAGAHADSLSLP